MKSGLFVLMLGLTLVTLGCIGEDGTIQSDPSPSTTISQPITTTSLEIITTSSSSSTSTTSTSTPSTSTTTSSSTTTSTLPLKPAGPALYELRFKATWSKETHPQDFPENPHFSPIIGASHSKENLLWTLGGKSSPGIKNMAENGVNTPLDNEINSQIIQGNACELYQGRSLSPSPGVITLNFTIDPDCPLFTMVTMIAPSPDWFIGANSLDLTANGEWMENKIIELIPYDAGTDSGSTYKSPDTRTIDPEPIHSINYPPVSVNGNVRSFGTFTFTLLN